MISSKIISYYLTYIRMTIATASHIRKMRRKRFIHSSSVILIPDIRITIAAPAFSNNDGFEINNLYTPARNHDNRFRNHSSLRSPLKEDKSSSPGKAKKEPRVVLVVAVAAAVAMAAPLKLNDTRRSHSWSHGKNERTDEEQEK